ncbi:MAG: hypothetical protein QOG55_3128 [Acidobacteriaceae bacterium]|jgi:hypothetical protein|nr:hypothetical protein [Acidobacteriaceae bacterium]
MSGLPIPGMGFLTGSFAPYDPQLPVHYVLHATQPVLLKTLVFFLKYATLAMAGD